jgi:hypothetical protein
VIGKLSTSCIYHTCYLICNYKFQVLYWDKVRLSNWMKVNKVDDFMKISWNLYKFMK